MKYLAILAYYNGCGEAGLGVIRPLIINASKESLEKRVEELKGRRTIQSKAGPDEILVYGCIGGEINPMPVKRWYKEEKVLDRQLSA
ncbi:MAG: hypothetical protein KJ767_00190 [Nanoarchaeota archaeon]|nr:hypothetical protein [Nanoarchaeota archaeon]